MGRIAFAQLDIRAEISVGGSVRVQHDDQPAYAGAHRLHDAGLRSRHDQPQHDDADHAEPSRPGNLRGHGDTGMGAFARHGPAWNTTGPTPRREVTRAVSSI